MAFERRLTTRPCNSILSATTANVFIKKNRCGHCKNLAPTYEKVAKDFARESDCVVANLDATSSAGVAEKYEVKGYPTIKFFPKGEDKTPINYEGAWKGNIRGVLQASAN